MQPTLFQLPAELLPIIFSMLPIRSQGCLALTCKTYHTQFKSIFRDDFFKLPGCQIKSQDRQTPSTEDLSRRAIERSLFLIQAQTQYWRYCASCRWLLPRCEFEEHELGERDEFRSCKWPGVSFLGTNVSTPKILSRSLTSIDSVLPWQFNHSFLEFDFDVTPLLMMDLSRDQDLCLALTSTYILITVPTNFTAAYPKVCPHIALFVLGKEARESRDWLTHCPFGNTTIHAHPTEVSSFRDRNGEYVYPCIVEVRRKFGRHSLSGKDLWWRLAQFGFKNADLTQA
jgi:hypothetical protein